MSRYSNYIIYLDEWGQHSEDEKFLVKNFCIFDKRHYGEVVIPKLQSLKFRHFGHDGIYFSVDGARGINQQQQFDNEINDLIEQSNFVLISCVVDKTKLQDQHSPVLDDMLKTGLDRCYRFLQERDQAALLTHVVALGQEEENNQTLQQSFRQLCAQSKPPQWPFELHLTADQHRPLGLQFVSLLSAPIITHYKNPEQSTPAFENLKTKFYCKGGRKNVGEGYEGWGLVQF